MSKTTFTVRSPIDLVALAPLVLGFVPTESVMIETFGGIAGPFHARSDLLDDDDAQLQTAQMLVDASRRNGVAQVAILVFSEGDVRARRQAAVCERLFAKEQVEVIDVLHVGAERFWRLPIDEPGGTPYDLSTHPFTTQRVLEGHVVHRSREEMEATLAPGDPEDRARVEAELIALLSCDLDLDLTHARADAIWMQGRIRRWVRDKRELTLPEVARMLTLCSEPILRDVAWAEMTRETAADHVEFWRRLLSLAPHAFVADVALMLAFASWLQGDGALAWCALDRFTGSTGVGTLAAQITGLLENAVPPSLWEPLDPVTLPVFTEPQAG